jgi:hypothetical protein
VSAVANPPQICLVTQVESRKSSSSGSRLSRTFYAK